MAALYHHTVSAFTTCMVLIVVLFLGVFTTYAQDVHSGDELKKRIRQLESKNKRLQTQLENVNTAYGQAKKSEVTIREELNKLKLELQSMGAFTTGSSEERLVQAVADTQILLRQQEKLQEAALDFRANMQAYLKQSEVNDPDLRLNVEKSMRKLDVTLGLRDKPAPRTIQQSSLHEAKVVSIDPKTGSIVLNIGSGIKAKGGMSFRIMRGESRIAEIILVEVRKDFSSALVTKLHDEKQPIRVGDEARINLVR